MPVAPAEVRAVVDSGQPIRRSYFAVLRLMNGSIKHVKIENIEGEADTNQTVRRTASITLAQRDRRELPLVDSAYVYCRAQLGRRSWPIPIGEFTIDEDSDLTLQGKSFEQLVVDFGFTAPWTCMGTTVAIMTNLIKQADSSAYIVVRPGVKDIPVLDKEYDPDPGARQTALDDLAAMSGAVWGTLPTGVWEIAPAPDMGATPAWVIDYRKQLLEEPILADRRRVPNVAVAISSNEELPIRAVALTADAAAAGYVGDVVVEQYGRYETDSIKASKRRLRQIQRDMPLLTQQQGVEAARFMLLEQSQGAARSSLVTVPNGWLTLNDVIYARGYGTHLVTAHPLYGPNLDVMDLTTLAKVL